ncbi:MAG TPA: hypothetical protein VGB30_07690 [bacterium]
MYFYSRNVNVKWDQFWLVFFILPALYLAWTFTHLETSPDRSDLSRELWH